MEIIWEVKRLSYTRVRLCVFAEERSSGQMEECTLGLSGLG